MTKASLKPTTKITVNEARQEIVLEDGRNVSLYSPEGFKLLSDLWMKVGWDQKHLYTFSWMGRPIIQSPEDVLRIQEVVHMIKPDVIVETGIAHGGSLALYASLCKAAGKGKVIGVDIEVRKHNREAIEAHPLFELITLIEANSILPETVQQIKDLIQPSDQCLVILDSCHDYLHVLEELRLYSSLVSVGSYIVATDGSQENMNDVPRAAVDYPKSGEWPTNNPKRAIEVFIQENDNFKICEPEFLFNESNLDYRVTHWPNAFLKRVK